MTLQFPTLAEQALEEFRTATKTVSLATIAKRRGALVEKTFDKGTFYTFDDDTSLRVTGTGVSHNVETLLP